VAAKKRRRTVRKKSGNQITVEVLLSGGFAKKKRDLVENLPWGLAIAAARSVGREEFEKEAWRPGSGPMRPWVKTKPFGAKAGPGSAGSYGAGSGGFGRFETGGPGTAFLPVSGKTLQRTGSLLSAWLGTGTGSFERIEKYQASFGLTGRLAEIDDVHRGKGTAADSRVPTRIKVTAKMRFFLGFVKGVWLKKTTTHIVIPKRPHFTGNPETATRIAAIFAAHIAGRPIPDRLVA
jgi:hypothetical protein